MLFWVLAIPAFFSGLWLKYIRKVQKLSPKRFLTASVVASAIEIGLLTRLPKRDEHSVKKSKILIA